MKKREKYDCGHEMSEFDIVLKDVAKFIGSSKTSKSWQNYDIVNVLGGLLTAVLDATFYFIDDREEAIKFITAIIHTTHEKNKEWKEGISESNKV